MTGAEYAALFKRTMRRPELATAEELDQLTEEDRNLFVIRCDVECEILENELRKRCGMPPMPPSQRVSKTRLETLRAAAARPEWSPLDIPLDEWIALCAGGQIDELTR